MSTSLISPQPPVTGAHLILADLYHGDFIKDNPNSIQMHDLVAAGIYGVILKAGQGVAYNDPVFKSCWDRAKSAGLKRGAYLFFDPIADPIEQAKHILSLIGYNNPGDSHLEPGDIPISLDVETAGPNVDTNAFAAAKYLKEVTGYWPIIYSGDDFYQRYLKKLFPGNLYKLWIARYGKNHPVTSFMLWQYTSTGKIGSIPHAVDLNVFMGTPSDFAKVCVQSA